MPGPAREARCPFEAERHAASAASRGERDGPTRTASAGKGAQRSARTDLARVVLGSCGEARDDVAEEIIMSQPIIENVRNGANDAWEATGDIASTAKHSVLDRLEQVARVARVVRAFGLDDVLYRVGLQRRRSPMVAAGAFGAGVLFGAGLALALVPATGLDVRGAISKLLRRVSKEEASLGSDDASARRADETASAPRPSASRHGGPLKSVETEPRKGNHDDSRTSS